MFPLQNWIFLFIFRIQRSNAELRQWVLAHRAELELARELPPDETRHFNFRRATIEDGVEWNRPIYLDFFLFATSLNVEHPTAQELANRELFFARLAPGPRHRNRQDAEGSLTRLRHMIKDSLKPPKPPQPPREPKPSKRRMKGDKEVRPRPKPYDPEGMWILFIWLHINYFFSS